MCWVSEQHRKEKAPAIPLELVRRAAAVRRERRGRWGSERQQARTDAAGGCTGRAGRGELCCRRPRSRARAAAAVGGGGGGGGAGSEGGDDGGGGSLAGGGHGGGGAAAAASGRPHGTAAAWLHMLTGMLRWERRPVFTRFGDFFFGLRVGVEGFALSPQGKNGGVF